MDRFQIYNDIISLIDIDPLNDVDIAPLIQKYTKGLEIEEQANMRSKILSVLKEMKDNGIINFYDDHMKIVGRSAGIFHNSSGIIRSTMKFENERIKSKPISNDPSGIIKEKRKVDSNKRISDDIAKKTVKPKIYFSYAWSEEREKIVNELYDNLKHDGYDVIRDKVDLGYKELISEFMKRIGKGDFIVVAISDKYLKSDNCMFELYEAYRNSKFKQEELLKRIYPIRVESLNLNDPNVRGGYYEYWENLESKTKELVNKYGENQIKHRRIEAIKLVLRDLLLLINDINTSTTEQLSKDNFEKIKTAIQERGQKI